MASAVSDSAAALFRHRPFLLYFCARGLSEFAGMIGAVAVGWQIYALTDSAFALGMVGLTQFIPTALLIFIAGHTADRYDRKRVAQLCQIAQAFTAAFLAWGSFGGWINVTGIFAAVAVFGIATAFENPTVSALLPGVVPEGKLQKGSALSTGVFQAAMVSGPAIGGLAYAIAPGLPYAAMTALWAVAAVLYGAIAHRQALENREPPTLRSLFAGVGFVRRHPAIFGTISLDLFAVLLGGVTALLPIYARDILHTGPWGLGLLRGAPAAGAIAMAIVLSHVTIERRAGLRMFQAVIVYGLATIAFALSHWVWVSILALLILGAADTVSMIIRISLVQLATPDDMRGRVGAVNFLFIHASYQLGEFESGMTAALFGAMPAAVLGGIGTIIVALLWMKLFPALRNVERLG